MNNNFLKPPAISVCKLLLLLALQSSAHMAWSQQQDPAYANIPEAPTGLANQPLPDGPFVYPTAEGMDIRVVVLTKAIEFPTSLAFPDRESILVTTRQGKLRLLRNGVLDPAPVAGGPKSHYGGESGLPGAIHGYIDIVLHPRFAENHLVYLSYTKPMPEGGSALALGRGQWNGKEISGFSDLWVADDYTNGPGRIAFARDGTLFLTTSGGDAQDLGTFSGKMLRFNDDGSVPKDNPFVGKAEVKPQIYSYGHRGSLGIAIHPDTGEVWQNENGPNGGDEINIIRPGRNYGWPHVSLGRDYAGPWQAGDRPTHEGFEPPVVYWMPAIAVSGMVFYTGDALPKWKGNILVGALRTGEIPGTGHLERILFNKNMEELRRESLLVDLRQRIRDVRQGPDGLIYVATDEKAGAVMRIEPVE
jgi:glucose/arabinose dehydrogenase